MSLITTAEQAYAQGITDLKKAGSVIKNEVLPVLQKLNTEAPTIEAVTKLVSPSLASIETAAANVLGVVIKAIEDAGTAAGAGGLSVSLDSALVNDIKAIIPAVKSAAPPVTPTT